jgi:hypothetical protein
MREPQLGQTLEITGPLMSKSKILANNDQLGVEAFDQDQLYKVLRAKASHGGVESKQVSAIDSGRCKRPELVPEGQNQAWCLLRLKKSPGMRKEAADHTVETLLFGGLFEVANQRLVPQVQTIETANGDRRPS